MQIEPERSHTLRNLVLSVATVGVLALVIFVATQRPGAQPEAPAAPVSQPAPVEAAQQPPPDPQPQAFPPSETLPDPPAETPRVETPPVEAPQKVAAAAVPPVSAAPKQGEFQLTTSPAGASATFDASGNECTTPCKVTLPAGRHVFVVRHAGFRETQRIILIPNDTGLIVDLIPMTGTLSLITNPAGLTVKIDGREQPQKTPLSLTLPVGPHKVEVVKGSVRQDLQIDLSDGQFLSKTISWQ